MLKNEILHKLRMVAEDSTERLMDVENTACDKLTFGQVRVLASRMQSFRTAAFNLSKTINDIAEVIE